ncbi:MAG TPA: transmembrane 220 family protein [Flavobacteriales bacterium]
MKKALLLLLALVFVAFAYLNLNDPDPIIWVTAYGMVALLFVLAAFGKPLPLSTAVLTGILFVWMCTLIPGMIDWFEAGTPSITSEMKATEPHIEVVREFLGLLIAVLATGGLWLSVRRKQ